MTHHNHTVIANPEDLSSLYFEDAPFSSTPYFVGPIQVVDDTHDAKDGRSTTGMGRRMIATRDVTAGQVLFVIPPAATAPVDAVYRAWTQSTPQSLADIAENVLVQTCLEQQHVADASWNDAVSALQGIHAGDATLPSLERLLGHTKSTKSTTTLSEAELRQIIRRNAFGPDFVTYDRIQQIWSSTNDNDTDTAPWIPLRILSVYPLAAMMNHSCHPNAVRVYCRSSTSMPQELMVVHACHAIAAGDELVWSYLPLIQSVAHRHAQLLETHGFVCHCVRCRVEQSAPATEARFVPDETPREHVDRLEAALAADTALSNEVQRYWRVSHLPIYLRYLNSTPPTSPTATTATLALATQLHLALAACHNASTEHLSILHWCYDLACAQHRHDERSLTLVRFWTDQLKRAILVRYGSVGNDVHVVRRLLHHTRTVLRHEQGVQHVAHSFL